MFRGEVFISQNAEKFVLYCVLLLFLGGPLLNINTILILGDPGADSGGKGKTKRSEKNGAKKSKERRALLAVLYFSSRHFFPTV